ncbi:putative aminotransferase class-V [Lyophyllum shimeji]|uniref:Aminotransferase class-V n=1 Tax=Lyophyllum shimeji TaxID=47721 RepID=A0A9P3PXN4_LYOSH|nr:putative aminotransferase class-V [Lyophyllum shimeji]
MINSTHVDDDDRITIPVTNGAGLTLGFSSPGPVQPKAELTFGGRGMTDISAASNDPRGGVARTGCPRWVRLVSRTCRLSSRNHEGGRPPRRRKPAWGARFFQNNDFLDRLMVVTKAFCCAACLLHGADYLLSLTPDPALKKTFEAIAAQEETLVEPLLEFLTAPAQRERGVRRSAVASYDSVRSQGRAFLHKIGTRQGHFYAYTLMAALSPTVDIDDGVILEEVFAAKDRGKRNWGRKSASRDIGRWGYAGWMKYIKAIRVVWPDFARNANTFQMPEDIRSIPLSRHHIVHW